MNLGEIVRSEDGTVRTLCVCGTEVIVPTGVTRQQAVDQHNESLSHQTWRWKRELGPKPYKPSEDWR